MNQTLSLFIFLWLVILASTVGASQGPTDLSPPALSATSPPTLVSGRLTPWLPPAIDSVVPAVQTGVGCPVSQVLRAAGQRMQELLENLQKLDATERVEHFRVDSFGSRGRPETRTFNYQVNITLSKSGAFVLDEYRNGSADPSQFPGRIATLGLPAMALLLHPLMVSDFNITCEGLGQWNAHPAWQIHFEQRADRPSRLRAYVIEHRSYAVPIKGRVWLDATTYQVQRLDSQLLKLLPEIGLTQERMAIDYGPVRFQTNKELWLPLHADVYWERRRQRYYRRHDFSDFKLFGIESTQEIQAPKESYCFKNTSDHKITGILTVSLIPETSAKPVSLKVTIPPGRQVCKMVGAGQDLNLSAERIGPATFVHDGHAGSIVAEVNLAGTLDVVPENGATSISP